ncbi:MAG: hypothetical protein Q8P56_06110 [Candidatus Uhrbacteria bacterium]|nr:hypothetical protein [Candidatus Uhrbacteria bacterium]
MSYPLWLVVKERWPSLSGLPSLVYHARKKSQLKTRGAEVVEDPYSIATEQTKHDKISTNEHLGSCKQNY